VRDERLDGLAVDRGVQEIERQPARAKPVFTKRLDKDRHELVHVNVTGDSPAPEAELRGGVVVVDAAGLVDRPVSTGQDGALVYAVVQRDVGHLHTSS
jgi:hypothetical protein